MYSGEAPDAQPQKRRPAGPRRRSGTSKLLQTANSATFSCAPDLGRPRAISALSHPIAIGLSQAVPAHPRRLAPALIAISAGRSIGAASGSCAWWGGAQPLAAALLCVGARSAAHAGVCWELCARTAEKREECSAGPRLLPRGAAAQQCRRDAGTR